MPIVSSKIRPDRVVYTDSCRACNALDVSRFQHHRINHSTDFAKGKNHLNRTLNFWSQAKRILRKDNGIHKEAFPLFIKKCEFRFNYETPIATIQNIEAMVSNLKSLSTSAPNVFVPAAAAQANENTPVGSFVSHQIESNYFFIRICIYTDKSSGAGPSYNLYSTAINPTLSPKRTNRESSLSRRP